jgi:hypothetical protein
VDAKLAAHIRKGDAYRSLVGETRVAETLRRLQWSVTHSAYYTDPIERKQREIDVVGRRRWTRRTDRYIDLNLLVECKSMPEKQILLAEDRKNAGEKLYVHWSGNDDDALHREIRAALRENEYAPADIARIVEKVGQSTYPRGESAIAALLVSAPKPSLHASAARETSRDTNTGPLWEAVNEVFAAMNGATQEELASTLDNFRFELANPIGNRVEWAIDRLLAAASTLILYHPIVVTDAPLFRLRKGNIEPIEWCRLTQARVSAGPPRWVDVIHSASFDDWSAKVTESYDAFFARRKCERVSF